MTPSDVNDESPDLKPSIRRNLLILFILLLLLVGLNLLFLPAANWQPVLDGAPGAVLYAAGFDGFDDEWQQYGGRQEAAIIDGTLRIRLDEAAKIAYSAASPAFTDFDLRADVRAVDGPIDNGYGLVFRLSIPRGDCDLPAVLLCDLASASPLLGLPLQLIFDTEPQQAKAYYFFVSSDGYYTVWLREEEQGESRRLSTWIPSEVIQQGLGATNNLRVIARGDRFQFFINGQQVPLCIPDDPASESTYFGGECLDGQMVDTLVDPTIASGQIGLAATTTQSGGGGVHVEFDNVIITSPQQLPQGDEA